MTRMHRAAAARAPRSLPVAATLAGAVLALAAVLPGRSQATFPGAEGPVAFQRFSSGREDDRTAQIFTRAPDGTIRRLTRFDGGAFHPAWSPDGSRLVFERWHVRARRPDELYTMNADGSGARPLTSGCTRAARCLADGLAAYSPDGRRIVFERFFGPLVKRRLPLRNRHRDVETIEQVSRVDLMIVDAGGGPPTRIRHYGRDPQPWDGAPAWSPDGRSILLPLGSSRHPSASAAVGTALHLIDAAGGGSARRITPWELGAANADWAPDGDRIVFNSEGGHTPWVYTVAPDGSGLTQLTKNGPGRDLVALDPVWSPDGRQIAFARETPGAGRPLRPMDIVVMNADGTGARAVISDSSFESAPAWAATR